MLAAILQTTEKIQFLELIKDGKTQTEIQVLMGLSHEAAKQLRIEVYGEMTAAYTEAVDAFRMVAFARYERLFDIADKRARGIVPEDVAAGERQDPVAALGMPDKTWFDRALAVLRDEQNLMKYDLEQFAKRQHDNTQMILNTSKTLTINSNDPMAKMAIEAMQRDWMNEAESPEEALLMQIKEDQDEGEFFGLFPEQLSIEGLEGELKKMQERLQLAKGGS